MSRSEYMRIQSKYFPPDIRDRYQIDVLLAADGYVYIKIIKVMYALKHAATIVYNKIISHMAPHVYYPVPFTTVIWEHKTRKTKFCLCVDDFGVKYFSKHDANHLLDSLKNYYAIAKDWERHNYLRLAIDWKYSKEYVNISMPNYVKKALDSLQHHKPKKQIRPTSLVNPCLWKILQMAPDPD